MYTKRIYILAQKFFAITLETIKKNIFLGANSTTFGLRPKNVTDEIFWTNAGTAL